MKNKNGSAILLVMLMLATMSGLLFFMQRRAALLLETVYEREKQLQQLYAMQGLLLYSAKIAKQNWSMLQRLLNEQSIPIEVTWPITSDQKQKGSIVYNLHKDGIFITVTLNGQKPAHCMVQLKNATAIDPEWVISEWKV